MVTTVRCPACRYRFEACICDNKDVYTETFEFISSAPVSRDVVAKEINSQFGFSPDRADEVVEYLKVEGMVYEPQYGTLKAV